MRSTAIAVVGVIAGFAPAALGAQTPGLSLTLFGGGAAFTSFQRQEVTLTENGEPRALRRDVAATTGAGFGAAAEWWSPAQWGVRAHFMTVPTSFELRPDVQEGADVLERIEVARGDLRITFYDVALLFRLPLRVPHAIPYVVLGGGAIRYAAEGDAAPSGATHAFRDGGRTSVAGVVGLGALVPVRSGLAFRFELTDYIARTPVRTVESATIPGEGGLDVVVSPAGTGSAADGQVRVTNNLRAGLGVTIDLGLLRSDN